MTDPVEVRSLVGGAAAPVADWIERTNPARTTELVGRAGAVDAAGAAAAVEASDVAFHVWRTVAPTERAALLLAAADAVAAATDELAPLLARELGKVVDDCRGEMAFAAACLRDAVGAMDQVLGLKEVDDDLGRLRIARVPFGVVVAVVPWNAPLILAMLKVAPALATGNTVVVKPSELVPLAVTRALEVIASHLPPGVLSVVHGRGDVGAALVGHPLTRKVAFTGSGATGSLVAAAAAHHVTPLVMELGGNDPAIFLDDADLTDEVLERAVFGAFLTSGQVCMAAKRFLVPDHRVAEFADAFTAVAERVLVVGDPLDPAVTVGPLVSELQQQRVAAMVDDARDRGAEIRTIGSVADGADLDAGWFMRPRLVLGLDDDAPLVRDEQFGPAVPVLGYATLDEAVARANASELALGSSVWSGDEARAIEVAARLEAGITFINCHNRAGMSFRAPFGGTKRSGYGREFGAAGLEEYVQTHTVHAPAAFRPGAGGGSGRAYPV
ncbi:MAG: aldehyde dehydrogenase family protein [Actinomycetes bacterium]